ncbi:uncharacterized protein LOC127838780 isoform X1 [Dreissena polymorpha]|nr:uncharacterized protein LOC127838780 isoform X1 [Dreissena polymorpha]
MINMGLGSIIVALAVFGACHGLDMTKLKPYNLTAELMFLTEDLNQDGIMTIAEIDAVFDKYDANGDGRETRNEYTMYICGTDPDLYQLSHYLYDDYDVDGDHHLDKHDYEAFHLKMDSNADGQVDKTEFVVYWVHLFEKYEGMGVHGQGGHCH